MGGLKTKITDFHYGKNSFCLNVLFFVPSFFYFLGICLKNFLYGANFLKETRTGVYVICVGNLTTGGVGKTPFVIELGNYFALRGVKTVILSRGYGGKLDKKVVSVVRGYNEILIDDIDLTGDEVGLISRSLKGAAVVVSPDRVKGAKYAKKELGADVVIMDDGFSNRKIYKNLNIVLVDTEKMFGNGFCLPQGPLREPVFEIKRADRVVFVDKTGKYNPGFKKFAEGLKVPYQICKMDSGEIYNITTGEILPNGAPVVAFSGIGSPGQFYDKITNIKKTVSFDDHFEYSQKTVDEINALIDKTGATAAVTTEKDMVKLLKFKNIEKFYALKLKPSFEPEDYFSEYLSSCAGKTTD